MREHLYKAKRVNWRELPKEEWWVEGNLITNERDETKAYIGYLFDVRNGVVEDFDIVEVIPETVCEYTGLTDKNGRKIFENDIIGRYSKHREEWDYGVVKYGEFNCSCCSGVYGWYFDDEDIRDCDMYEVRGNVFDNPELLQNNQ